MKHLEDTPWWICDSEDTNYCTYSDTDSIYMHAEPILRHRHSNFDEMSAEEKDNALENIAMEYEDVVTKSYDKLAKEVFRSDEHRLESNTENQIKFNKDDVDEKKFFKTIKSLVKISIFKD